MTEKELIQAMKTNRDYWLEIAKGKGINHETYEIIKDAINGTIFSMFVMVDGDSGLNDFKPIKLVSSGKIINDSNTELHDLWCKLN